MPSWLSVLVLLAALVGLFFWLPWGFALVGAVLIAFLIFLELFLAEIKGRYLLSQREAQRERRGVRITEDSPRETTVGALWLGLTAEATSSHDHLSSHEGLAGGGGFDSGFGDGGGDGGGGGA